MWAAMLHHPDLIGCWLMERFDVSAKLQSEYKLLHTIKVNQSNTGFLNSWVTTHFVVAGIYFWIAETYVSVK